MWLGFDPRTTQHVVFDHEQSGIRHARTLMSLPDPQKFDRDRAAKVSATAWSVHESTADTPVFEEKATADTPVAPETVPPVREVYI